MKLSDIGQYELGDMSKILVTSPGSMYLLSTLCRWLKEGMM